MAVLDAVVQVETLEDFDRVKRVLELKTYGFMRTRGPFHMKRGASKIFSAAFSPDRMQSGIPTP